MANFRGKHYSASDKCYSRRFTVNTKENSKNKAVIHTGEIVTPYGIVAATTWKYDPDSEINIQSTYLEFILGGLCYTRAFEKAYSRRYITTLADQFTKDVIESILIEEPYSGMMN